MKKIIFGFFIVLALISCVRSREQEVERSPYSPVSPVRQANDSDLYLYGSFLMHLLTAILLLPSTTVNNDFTNSGEVEIDTSERAMEPTTLDVDEFRRRIVSTRT